MENPSSFQIITPLELSDWMRDRKDFTLIDVREEHEFAYCKLDKAILCPVSDFVRRFQSLELGQSKTIVLYCHHGFRSAQAANYLLFKGYSSVYNLLGGIDAWSQEVDETIPRY